MTLRKKSLLKSQKYLWAALFCLLVAGVLQRFVFSEANTELFIKHVKERLVIETDIADDQIFRIKQKLKQSEQVDFERFLGNSKYPTFIYRKRKLLFWSDHTSFIDYFDLMGFYDERCFETPKEKSLYLAKKSMLTLKNQDYEIVVLIPLRKRYQVDSKVFTPTLNPDIFPNQGVRIGLSKGDTPIYNRFDSYLFSIFFPDGFTYYSNKRWIVLLFVVAGLVLFGIQLWGYLQFMLDKNMAGRATLLLAGTLLLLRGAMLYYVVPYSYVPYQLFESKTFASSIISPSLGDLFLNIACLSIVGAFIFINYPKIIRYRRILPLNEAGKSIVSTAWVVVSYASLYVTYSLIYNMLSNSNYSTGNVFVDISRKVDLSTANLVSLAIFVLMSAIYFFCSHITARLLIKLGDSVYDAPIRFVAGSLIYYLGSLALGLDDIFIFNINALYLIFITFFSLPFFVHRSDYSTYIYLFAWGIVSACVGSYAIADFQEERDTESKKKYATKIILENDEVAEFYLSKLIENVERDTRMPILFEQKNVDKILSKVKKSYMKRYLDRYHVDIQLYDSEYEAMNTRRTHTVEIALYNKQKYATEFEGIYFINDVYTGNKTYIVFIDVEYKGSIVGHIVMKLLQRRAIPNSIDYNFITLKNYSPNAGEDNYSYAIYGDERLIYSSGDYPYTDPFLKSFRHESGFWLDEVVTESHRHLRMPNDKDRHVIITSPKYPFNNALSNFAFLFLVLVFILLMTLSSYNLYFRTSNNRLNFNTKIQLYLNFAFFLPLIVVSIIILSILNNTNRQETEIYYLDKAQSIGNDLRSDVELYKGKKLSREDLNNKIAEIANITQSNINLFDEDGKLIVSSQDYIYDNQLLARYMNPHAYTKIIEQHQNKTMLEEELGNLQFNAAYVSIRAPGSNDVAAVVGVPFFGFKQQYENQARDVLAKIMQVFALILILLLALSYVSARSLTAPLRLIRQELRKVSFQDQNKPLDYISDDEIGLLVNEYNKMLLKLEESRDALSRSEKESAWREMAKQVAHEIKNPLTPMKLNLQQLQRVLDASHPLAERSIKMLITQIDTLSDIATSFSAFARMPLPKEDRIDLSVILKEVVSLHDKREGANINLEIKEESLPVLGDAKLLGRIFSNLMINGIQATAEGEVAQLEIVAELKRNYALLTFKDSGLGIPLEVRQKVFLPNFTTKSTGTGIGLAIAKRGIEQLQGRIWFETEENQGTTFYIEMPLLPEEE